MFKSNSLIVLLIAAVLITACTPSADATPIPVASVTPLPQIVNSPTIVTDSNTSTAVPQPTSAPSICPCFEGLSNGLDNATQARIRTISMVMGAPKTDVYVNDKPALNGGIAQQNIGAGQFSGYLYVAPGTYTIALVPHDGSMDQALFAPEDISVEAGHRYTVAAMGQLADKDVLPLVVDETALEAGSGAGATDSITIDINNVTGIDSITELADGKTYAENIKYGEAQAWFVPSGNPVWSLLVNINGQTQKVWEDNGFAEPGVSFVLPWFGPFPPTNIDDIGNVSQGTSELNVPGFLAGFDGRIVNIDGHLATFNTFLKLIDKAGWRAQLEDNGPYFLMAPTDDAFSKLPQADLDKLLNDPQALAGFLNAHIVDGYYPSGSLSGALYGQSNRTVTNRLGQSLAFVGDTLNGHPIGPNYTAGDGNRVQIIFTLLPSK